jgi:hypothetical protein
MPAGRKSLIGVIWLVAGMIKFTLNQSGFLFYLVDAEEMPLSIPDPPYYYRNNRPIDFFLKYPEL